MLKICMETIFHTENSFRMTALTQSHYFSPYCDGTGNLGIKIAHSPVTT